MSAISLTVEVEVNAPLEKVWECYTDPAHIVNWNFASDDWHCPSAINELQRGGKMSWRMEAKDGSFGFDFEGTFDEVIEHVFIDVTLGDGRKSQTLFEDLLGQTLVTTNFETEDQNSADLQQQGWQAILNNFKKYVESL